MANLDILRVPDRVTAFCEGGSHELRDAAADGNWAAEDVAVTTQPQGRTLPVRLSAPVSAVKRLRLRWNQPKHGTTRVLGDHWERGYGDLEWRAVVAERPLPWYFLAHDGVRTHGVGVKTGTHSLCFWQMDTGGITLTLDVRSGGVGVQLGERVLDAATIAVRDGAEGETPFAAAQAFCRLLCPSPLMPRQPVYGGNNWYYAYGTSSHQQILDDSELIASVSPNGDNRPYMVIDDGWQLSGPHCTGGPWRCSNAAFPDMLQLAQDMTDIGVRPGLWMRPLTTVERVPYHWFRDVGTGTLDPSVPEVLEMVRMDISRCVGWGYEMIKHDFSTYDIFDKRWGFEMGGEIVSDGLPFATQTLTTAEIVLNFYRAIREAAGEAVLIGCNVIGHLAAGLIEIQRTGDDTSGRDWNRTRKMGVNTLAFRMPQHEAFFASDADCVGLTSDVPWALNSQWLDLLARSGTPLFVSAAKDAVGPAQTRALKAAFTRAALPQPAAEPLDWLDTTCPSRWKFGDEVAEYDWYSGEVASSSVP